jgi:hypothetical protein
MAVAHYPLATKVTFPFDFTSKDWDRATKSFLGHIDQSIQAQQETSLEKATKLLTTPSDMVPFYGKEPQAGSEFASAAFRREFEHRFGKVLPHAVDQTPMMYPMPVPTMTLAAPYVWQLPATPVKISDNYLRKLENADAVSGRMEVVASAHPFAAENEIPGFSYSSARAFVASYVWPFPLLGPTEVTVSATAVVDAFFLSWNMPFGNTILHAFLESGLTLIAAPLVQGKLSPYQVRKVIYSKLDGGWTIEEQKSQQHTLSITFQLDNPDPILLALGTDGLTIVTRVEETATQSYCGALIDIEGYLAQPQNIYDYKNTYPYAKNGNVFASNFKIACKPV